VRVYLAPVLWLAENYLKYNPFFIYGGRNPLLHQTEVVAKSLFLKPTRMLIADVIGLGKTVTALRILKTLSSYRRLNRVLVAVPSVLVDQWIDEMRSMGISPQVIERRNLDFLAKHSVLPAGWYIGSIDTLKRPEYMIILKRSKWDAIVVDEAHKLGVLGREPNLRWQSLGGLIRENRDAIVLLLSATPHRGKANDYLARLALIDPTLLEVTNIGALERVFDKPDYYQRTHNIIVFRRSKEDVNKVYECIEVFKPCNMLAVLIEPNEDERLLLRTVTELAVSYLSKYYGYVMETFGWKTGRVQGVIALLRTLLVKRGLSSPQALVKTFSKLVEKRGRFLELIEEGYSPEEAQEKIAEELERYGRKLDELLTGDIGEHEEELDEEFDKLTPYFDRFLDEEFREELKTAVEYAKRILLGDVKDSKLETLKKILRLVLQASPDELPEDFRDLASGKAIVFTEFKDTAYYLYDRLRKWAEEEFGNRDIVRIFTSDNRGEIEEIKRWLAEEGKRVLVTTDVAGEGLNLQCANVLVNYEIAWSPVRLEQRIGRVWRYGQSRVTYVFNLFLADALEKEVAEIVFAKLYGITISLGKLEPIIGEKVFLSTIRRELLEHAIEEEKAVGGLVPVEIEFKGRKLSLSEMRIIDLVAKDAKAFVVAFIKALKKLIREIKFKRVYPHSVEAEKVRKDLRYLTGFSDTKEADESARMLLRLVAEILDAEIDEQDSRILLKLENGRIIDLLSSSPEKILEGLLRYFSCSDYVKYFVFRGNEKKVLLLTEAKFLVGGEVRYKEPIGIVADFCTKSINILRGKTLVKEIFELLMKSIPIDEVHGLSNMLSSIPSIINASYNTFYENEAREGAIRIIEAVKEYENFKKKLRGIEFFETNEPQVEIEEFRFVFFSSAFLPEVSEVVSEEVWSWAEDEALPVIFNYEGLNGREAIRVSGFEHYDIKSVKRDSEGRIIEERFIEVKTKMGKSLTIRLTEEETKVAKEKGDKYWLYLVYGVKTEKPVILAIRNPLERLPFRRKVAIEKREEYYFSLGQ